MAILGNNVIKASAFWASQYRYHACLYTAPAPTGPATDINLYAPDSADNGGLLHLGIYADNGARHPGALVEDCGIVAIAGAPAWQQRPATAVITGGALYHLVYVPNLTTFDYRCQAGAAEQKTISGVSHTWGNPLPNPFPLTAHTHQARDLSVYVTYAPAPPPAVGGEHMPYLVLTLPR